MSGTPRSLASLPAFFIPLTIEMARIVEARLSFGSSRFVEGSVTRKTFPVASRIVMSFFEDFSEDSLPELLQFVNVRKGALTEEEKTEGV